MRTIIFGVVLLLAFSSCKTSESAQPDFYEAKKVSISNPNFEFIVNTPWFDNDLSVELIESNYVEVRGDSILEQILKNYSSQVFDVDKVPLSESNVQFELKKLNIKRAYFTINFPNPGPIYRVSLEVDIYEKGVLVSSEKYRSRVNMSEINFGHILFKWLDTEERNNQEYQLATLEVGLRNIFQKLYFNYFNISLSL